MSNTQNPQVLVCQQGARRRYAVARMFQQEGMLAALYTNSSRNSLLGRCAVRFEPVAPQVVRRLAQRAITGIPAEKIFSSDAYTLLEVFQKVMHSQRDRIQLFLQRDRILSKRMKIWGLQNTDIIYSMYYENLDFVRWAKSQGVKCVVDVYINPQTSELMNRECELFPDWSRRHDDSMVRQEYELWKEISELADVLLCPSEWVATGVRNLTPAAAYKIRIVPYGCSIDFQGRTNTPVQGRLLFAGGDPLRKGLHYLAEAATRLKSLVEGLDVRIAGTLPDKVVNHPHCKDLNFLGKLNLDQMKAEYLSSDVFVLPSLSEGFAGVVAEAIGAGCPVIVTREAGSPVLCGREGIVIPSRDADALVGAIEQMVQDRHFRNKCSYACLEQRTFYSEKEWMKRLIAVLAS